MSIGGIPALQVQELCFTIITPVLKSVASDRLSSKMAHGRPSVLCCCYKQENGHLNFMNSCKVQRCLHGRGHKKQT